MKIIKVVCFSVLCTMPIGIISAHAGDSAGGAGKLLSAEVRMTEPLKGDFLISSF